MADFEANPTETNPLVAALEEALRDSIRERIAMAHARDVDTGFTPFVSTRAYEAGKRAIALVEARRARGPEPIVHGVPEDSILGKAFHDLGR